MTTQYTLYMGALDVHVYTCTSQFHKKFVNMGYNIIESHHKSRGS